MAGISPMSSQQWMYLHSELSIIIPQTEKLVGMVSLRSVAISIETAFNDLQISKSCTLLEASRMVKTSY